MTWKPPKINYIPADGVTDEDLNRVEGNTLDNHDRVDKIVDGTIPAAEATNADNADKLDGKEYSEITDYIDSNLPTGIISMWSGAIVSIPATWTLCDGTDGTPDLRDRFVVGAGSSYSVGTTGGADSVTLTEAQIPSHSHSFSDTSTSAGSHVHSGSTNTTGDHNHSYTDDSPAGVGDGLLHRGGEDEGLIYTKTTGTAGNHSHSLNINSNGAHTHNVSGTTGSAGSGSSHENRPPYYALAYIMKL